MTQFYSFYTPLKLNYMTITFNVTLDVDSIDSQPIEQFENEDAKAMIPYLKELIEDTLLYRRQYNAKVYKVKVTQQKKNIRTVQP